MNQIVGAAGDRAGPQWLEPGAEREAVQDKKWPPGPLVRDARLLADMGSRLHHVIWSLGQRLADPGETGSKLLALRTVGTSCAWQDRRLTLQMPRGHGAQLPA